MRTKKIKEIPLLIISMLLTIIGFFIVYKIFFNAGWNIVVENTHKFKNLSLRDYLFTSNYFTMILGCIIAGYFYNIKRIYYFHKRWIKKTWCAYTSLIIKIAKKISAKQKNKRKTNVA